MPASIALQCTLHTLIFNEGRHKEISIVQGENRYLAMSMQALQTVQVLGLATLAAKAAGYQGIPFSLKFTAIVLPYALGFATALTPHASRLSPILATLHRNLGRLNLTATIAAGVALIRLGHPIAGSTIVSILAVEILTERGVLPSKWRQRYRFTLYPAYVASCLFAGDWLNFINGLLECTMRAMNIAFIAMQVCFSVLFEPPKFKPYRHSRLTPEILEKIQLNPLCDILKTIQNGELIALLETCKKRGLSCGISHIPVLLNYIKDTETRKLLEKIQNRDLRFSEIPETFLTPELSEILENIQNGELGEILNKHQNGQLRLILQNVENAAFRLKVNYNYVTKRIMPPIPDCDIDDLVKQFDAFNWNGNNRHERSALRALENKVRSDKRYKSHGAGEEPLAFARQQLVDYVYSIKHRQILEGEPRDYQLLEDYLKFATHELQTADDMTRTDILTKLAVEGGNYCGPAKFDAAEEVAFSLMQVMDEITFVDRMLLGLERQRASILQAIFPYTTISTVDLPDSLEDTVHDRHVYNLFLNVVATGFGVRVSGAENDTAFELPYILRRLLNFDLTMLGVIEDPWVKHTPASIVDYLQETLGTDALPQPEYSALWEAWIDQLKDETLKAQFKDERLMDGTINGMEDDYRCMIQAMLYDIGILRAA